jgi:predicted AAA+ superfamily ATPase
MEIDRFIRPQIIADLKQDNKIVLLNGPRQSGKTTLSKQIIREMEMKSLN